MNSYDLYNSEIKTKFNLCNLITIVCTLYRILVEIFLKLIHTEFELLRILDFFFIKLIEKMMFAGLNSVLYKDYKSNKEKRDVDLFSEIDKN